MARKEETLSNFLPINRRFFSHPFWKEKRTFSKSEAWLDLIVSARFEESEVTELIGGKLVSWTRGQLPASLRYLAERWMWSKNKVDDFLYLLEKEDMIGRILTNGQTIITLKNYESYNSRQQKGQGKGQQGELPQRTFNDLKDKEKDSKEDIRGTQEGQARDETNNINKGNIEEVIVFGANAPTYTKEDLDRFREFEDWIKKNTPNVGKMKEPLTIQQYMALRGKLEKVTLTNLLYKMHNYRPLLQKNISAYLTIINWSKRDFNAENSKQNESTEEYIQKRKKLELQAAERAAK